MPNWPSARITTSNCTVPMCAHIKWLTTTKATHRLFGVCVGTWKLKLTVHELFINGLILQVVGDSGFVKSKVGYDWLELNTSMF